MKHCMSYIRTLFTLGCALLMASPVVLHAADQAKPKPNISFVLFDDMGYGQPKCYREGTEFKTPNMDLLAREEKEEFRGRGDSRKRSKI